LPHRAVSHQSKYALAVRQTAVTAFTSSSADTH